MRACRVFAYVIKVSDDLVKKAEPLHPLLIDFGLTVHTPELGDRSKYHTGTLTALRVVSLWWGEGGGSVLTIIIMPS